MLYAVFFIVKLHVCVVCLNCMFVSRFMEDELEVSYKTYPYNSKFMERITIWDRPTVISYR